MKRKVEMLRDMAARTTRPLMKKCPYCGKEYPDDATICAVDQQPLQEVRPPLLNRPAPAPFPAPSGDARQITDNEHLKMLSIFYYVLAGFAFAGLLFLGLQFVIMTAIFTNPGIFNSPKNQSGPPVEFFIPFFMFLYLIIGVIMALAGVLNLLSANFLRRRTHHTFSLVVAGLNCFAVSLRHRPRRLHHHGFVPPLRPRAIRLLIPFAV